MKNYIKQIIFFSIGLLLIIGVLVVDVVFYKVPSFIKVFRLEREAAAVVAMFLIFPLIKAIYFQRFQDIKKHYISLFAGFFLLLGLLLLPHLVANKYITLWENNPMLAEFPNIWTIYSVLNAVAFVLLLILFLEIIKKLVVIQENISMKLVYNLAILFIFVGSGFMNVLEDRYLYQPVLDGYMGLFNEYKIAIYSFILISSTVSIRGDWINKLDKKNKLICFGAGILSLLILLYLFSSQYIVAVYAFSTTLKGFVLLGYLFVSIFFAVSTIKILFHLPTAAKMERTSQELNFITEIENRIKKKESLDSLLDTIVQQSMKITDSNACWFEMMDIDGRYKITNSENVNDDIIESIGSFTIDELNDDLVIKKNLIMINSIKDHSMTKNFKYLDIPWKSLLALPIIQDDAVIAILYTAKNRSNGFSKDDENTLSRFLTHLEKVFTPTIIDEIQHDEIDNLHFVHENYSVDVIGSQQLTYDSICEGVNCCIFGISRNHSSEKIAELRGSLKILLQMNSPIEMIKQSIDNLMKFDNEEHLFILFNTDSKQVSTINSPTMCYALCDGSIEISTESPMTTSLDNWGIFNYGLDSKIDISQISKQYTESGCITDIYDNFYVYFSEEIKRENVVFIQSLGK